MLTFALRSCAGQNSAVPPSRCAYNADTGAWESPLLHNVDLDDTGRLTRRRGFSRLQTGDWHSMWGNGDLGYVVNGSTLYEVNEAGVLLALKTDMLPSFPVSYAAVDDVVYWCNSGQKGKIIEHQAVAWGGGAYPYADAVREIGDVPVGHLVCYHAGRLFVAVDNVVYFTEGAGFFDFADLESNHLPFYDSKILMLLPVDDGLYVGTDSGVQFVAGTAPDQFQYRQVSARRPIPGVNLTMSGHLIDPDIVGAVALWADRLGVTMGMLSGVARSITKDRFIMPAVSSGCGLLYDNKFVALLAP